MIAQEARQKNRQTSAIIMTVSQLYRQNHMQTPERFSRFEYLGEATQPQFVQRVLEVLEIIHPFDDFERSDVMTMLAKMDCFRAPARSTVIYEDEPGDFMILLLEGKVEPRLFISRFGVA